MSNPEGRRKGLRKRMHLTVRVSRPEDPKVEALAHSIDVSESGMQVQVGWLLRRLETVVLRFAFPGEDRSISAQGVVRWARPCTAAEGGAGFRAGLELRFADPETAAYYANRCGGGSMVMV